MSRHCHPGKFSAIVRGVLTYLDSPVTIPEWTIGDRLRKARRTAGITRDELAADIGCSAKTLGNYENDMTRAPKLVVKHYARCTGFPYSWLVEGEDHGPFPPNTPATECYLGLKAA